MTNNNVAEKKSTAVASADLMDKMLQDSGNDSGFENVTSQDITVPYLKLLQAMSTAITQDLVDQAKAGDFLNSASNQLFKGTIKIVPCYFKRMYDEWAVDADGSMNFVKTKHEVSTDILSKTKRNDKNQDMLENGNAIVDTAYYFCLLKNDEKKTYDRVVLSLSSTQLAAHRSLMQQSQQLTMPNSNKPYALYTHTYDLSTFKHTKGNNTWFKLDVKNPQKITEPLLYEAVLAFREDIKNESVQAAQNTRDDVSTTSVPPQDTSEIDGKADKLI